MRIVTLIVTLIICLSVATACQVNPASKPPEQSESAIQSATIQAKPGSNVSTPLPGNSVPSQSSNIIPSPSATISSIPPVCSALAVYMDHPYPGVKGIDYLKTPITITGWLNYPEAKVVVNGIEASVKSDGNFSASVQFKEGGNPLQAVASLGEKSDEVTYYVGVNADGTMFAVPGLGGGGRRYLAEMTFNQSLEMTAGKTQLVDVMFEPRKESREPQNVDFTISGIVDGSDNVLPMPQGLKAGVNPAAFMACPNTTYHSTLTIETDGRLPPGEYLIQLTYSLQKGSLGSAEMHLKVDPNID